MQTALAYLCRWIWSNIGSNCLLVWLLNNKYCDIINIFYGASTKDVFSHLVLFKKKWFNEIWALLKTKCIQTFFLILSFHFQVIKVVGKIPRLNYSKLHFNFKSKKCSPIIISILFISNSRTRSGQFRFSMGSHVFLYFFPFASTPNHFNKYSDYKYELAFNITLV